MKNPLIYQLTEDSCGATAVANCVNFLFDREEMPTEFLKILSAYSLNCFDDAGHLANNDFSESFSFFVSSWINDYASKRHIPLKARLIKNDDVNLLEIKKCLGVGGVVSLRSAKNKNNYIIITNMDNEDIYIFDSLYQPESAYRQNINIKVENGQPFSYNRKVKIEYFIKNKNDIYCLGDEANREAILFFRNDTIKQRDYD